MKLAIRTLIAPLTALALFVAGTSSAQAHGGLPKPPVVKMKFGHDRFVFNFGCAPRPHRHVHAHHFVHEKVWFAPVYENVIVGYQHCGTPIYRRVMTHRGHYKTAMYKVCGCGDKVFVRYV
jgi:hypothetical protein